MAKTQHPTNDQTESQTMTPAKHLMISMKINPKIRANPAVPNITSQVLAMSFIAPERTSIESVSPILIEGANEVLRTHILES